MCGARQMRQRTPHGQLAKISLRPMLQSRDLPNFGICVGYECKRLISETDVRVAPRKVAGRLQVFQFGRYFLYSYD